MSVGRICTRVVATAAPDETVREVARRMSEHDVGTLVVVDGPTQAPLGIVTDRDLVLRCLATNRDPDQTPLREVMTTPVQAVDEHTPIEQAMTRMAHAGVRRLVVTGPGGALAGLLSLDDVLELVVDEVAIIGQLLAKQAPTLAF